VPASLMLVLLAAALLVAAGCRVQNLLAKGSVVTRLGSGCRSRAAVGAGHVRGAAGVRGCAAAGSRGHGRGPGEAGACACCGSAS
jgi:hypothetical protein